MNTSKIFSSTDEYIAFVEKFCSLLDEQMLEYENQAQIQESLPSLIDRLPPLISLVNTVGYLRGQDGLFIGIRPMTSDQSKLYEFEQKFEARLERLIQLLLKSDLKHAYVETLRRYLLDARTRAQSEL